MKAELVAAGWPSWETWVEHGEGDDWREVTEQELFSAQSHRGPFSTGREFILRRAKPPSDDYFRAKICEEISNLSKLEAENRKLLIALELGRLISFWEHRRAFSGW